MVSHMFNVGVLVLGILDDPVGGIDRVVVDSSVQCSLGGGQSERGRCR